MSTLVKLAELAGLWGFWSIGMYSLGRVHGVAAEHRRVAYLIDVVQCTVVSWTVTVFQEAFRGRVGVEDLRVGLRNKWNWEKLK